MILLEEICVHIVPGMTLDAKRGVTSGRIVKNGHFYEVNYQESAI